jgi:hypothetical protein
VNTPSPPVGWTDLEDMMVGLESFGFGAPEEPATPPDEPSSPLGGLVYRPALYRRNAVSRVAVRSWRARARDADVMQLKRCKAAVDSAVIAAAAGEIARVLLRLFGCLAGWAVTSVACGHSRRPDCFGKRLGAAVTAELGLGFVEIFKDRFVAGVSHPKEFKKLPALKWQNMPATPVLIIDDLATSGWHIEEALGMIRNLGLPAFGAVWICRTVK